MIRRYALIILLTVGFMACKKNSPPPDLKTQMIGKWTYISLIGNIYDLNGKFASSGNARYNSSGGDYLQFNSDGTFVQHIDYSTSTNTYSINSEKLFTWYPEVIDASCRVVSIDNNTFTFIEKINYANSYTEYTHSLRK